MCAAPFHNFGHKNGRLTQKQLNSFKDADADASLIGDYVGVVGCDGRAPEGYTCSGPRLGMENSALSSLRVPFPRTLPPFAVSPAPDALLFVKQQFGWR